MEQRCGDSDLQRIEGSASYDVDVSNHTDASRGGTRVLINNTGTLPFATPQYEYKLLRYKIAELAAQLASGVQAMHIGVVRWKRRRGGALLVVYLLLGSLVAALFWASVVFPIWAIIHVGEDHEAQSNIFLGVSSKVPLSAYLTGLDRTAVRFCPGTPPICSSYIWWWSDAATWTRAIESYNGGNSAARYSHMSGDPRSILGEHSTAIETSWLTFNPVVELSGCISIFPYIILLTAVFATLSVMAVMVQWRQEADDEAEEIEREAAAAVSSRTGDIPSNGAITNNSAAGPDVVNNSVATQPSQQPPWTRRSLLRSISTIISVPRPLPNSCNSGGPAIDPYGADSSSSSSSHSSSIGTSRLRWPEGLMIAAACGALFVAGMIAFGHIYNEDFWRSVYTNMETDFTYSMNDAESAVDANYEYITVSLEYMQGLKFFVAGAVINMTLAIIALI